MAGVFKHLSPTSTWVPGMIQKSTGAECQGVNSNQATPVDSLIFTDIHGMIVDSWRGAHGHRHIERTIFLFRTCNDVSAYKSFPSGAAAFPRPGTLIQRCLRRAPGKWLL